MTTTSPSTADLARAAGPLSRLDLRIRRRLDGLVHGDVAGIGVGSGDEHGDAHEYRPGDDVRRIDWNLTARTGAPHVRDTIADRELQTWFVVDGSASLDYGTADREKRDLAVAVVAAVGHLVARAGNRTGGLVFDADGSHLLAPRAGRDAIVGLVGRLDRRPRAERGAASLADALRRVGLLARRPGLVVVVSDLLDDSPWEEQLRRLTTRHDVVVAHLTDPREDDLPAVGMLLLVDPETGARQEVQTSSRRFRERYAAAARHRRETATAKVRRCRAQHLAVSTDRDWLPDVVRFVAASRRRR